MDKSSQEFVVLLMIIFSRNCLERWEKNDGDERERGGGGVGGGGERQKQREKTLV